MTATVVAPARTVRQWAAEQGYEVSGRGRIHQEILDRYAEAHPNSTKEIKGEPPVIPNGTPTKLGRPKGSRNKAGTKPKAAKPANRKAPATKAVQKPRVAEIVPATARAWLNANGYQLPDRGRIPRDLMKVYQEAMGIVPLAPIEVAPPQAVIKSTSDARTKIYVVTSSKGTDVFAVGDQLVLVEHINLTNQSVEGMLDGIAQVRKLPRSPQRSALLARLTSELSFVVQSEEENEG